MTRLERDLLNILEDYKSGELDLKSAIKAIIYATEKTDAAIINWPH